jgi:hypothetical protein
MLPNVPMERDTPSPEPLVYLFMYVCQSPPKKGALLQNGEKYKVTVQSPMQTEGLHTMGCGLAPQGDR